MAEVSFYVLGALALAFAMGVVLAKSPMMSVISLLGSFFCLAVIYLLAGFQFLAAAQILVYAGAILVLFLFVIMLLNLGDLEAVAEARRTWLKAPTAKLAVVLAVGSALVGLIAAGTVSFPPLQTKPGESLDALTPIAIELFGRYSLAFEAASILLLVSMVAVMVLAKRQRRGEAERGEAKS